MENDNGTDIPFMYRRVVIEATDGARGRLGGGKYVTNRYHDISRTKTLIIKHDGSHGYDTIV